MEFDIDPINSIILFGAIQGFLLCPLLYKKRMRNVEASIFFILFLFSLSFLNLFFGLMDSGVLHLYKPLYVIPFPDKYLLGPCFLFYSLFNFGLVSDKKELRKLYFLFVPALFYGFLLLYWFSTAVSENSYRIVGELVKMGVFRVNEYLYLLFILGIIVYLKQRLKQLPKYITLGISFKTHHVLLNTFLALVILNLILSTVDLIVHKGDDTMLFNYPHLIINSLFIYWIGFKGFLNPKALIAKSTLKQHPDKAFESEMEKKLGKILMVDERYKKSDLTLKSLAKELQVPANRLSEHIKEKHKMKFKDYINQYRIKKVKELLQEPQQKYTMVALAEEAGFGSKSIFYTTFKRATGMTPSEYSKRKDSDVRI